MRISDWSSDVCSSALPGVFVQHARAASFGSRREELAKVGAQQLEARHPTYPAAAGAMPQLPEFVLARYRIARRFRAMESGESPPKPRILFVISTRIGGVPQTNADLMRGLEGAYDSLALRCNRREIELRSDELTSELQSLISNS